MTSWSVVFSISFMRSTENFARALICSSASRGMVPISACTSQTAISTSSHFWNLVCSDQSAPISGKVYLEIIGFQVSSFRFQVCRAANLKLETLNLKLHFSAVELTKYLAIYHLPSRSIKVKVSIAWPCSNDV